MAPKQADAPRRGLHLAQAGPKPGEGGAEGAPAVEAPAEATPEGPAPGEIEALPAATLAEDPSGASEGAVLPPEKVTNKELSKWQHPKLHTIPIMSLEWDEKMIYGQIRELNQARVDELVRSVRDDPPQHPIRVLVRRLKDSMR